MKKIVLVFMVLAVTFTSAFAQEADFIDTDKKVNLKTNEVYLAAGSSSFVGLFSGIFVGIADAIPRSQGEGSNTTEAYPFGVTAGYNHFFWNHLGVGGFVSYESFQPLNLITIQAKVTGQYGWEHFKFYHAISGGIVIVPGGGVSPAFDVTVLGLKADFERFNIFLEGSFPTTSIVKAGASFKF